MSNLLRNCLDAVRESNFRIIANRFGQQIEVSNACLLWTNFAGAANKFGNTSKNFNIVIPEELAMQLRDNSLGLSVNVHEAGKGDEEEPKVYYINVKVNMTVQYPPEVTLYVKHDNGQPTSKTLLTDSTIACLDRTDIERADVMVNVKESKARPGWAVFYLNMLKVVHTKSSAFGGYYDDMDDPLMETNPEIEAQNAGIMSEDD